MHPRRSIRQFCFYTAVFFISLNLQTVSAQSTSSIIITGQAIDANTHHAIKPLQIINKRNIQRFYGDSLGNFIVEAAKNDTLYFVAKGYATFALSYKDSSLKKFYALNLRMRRMSVDLPEVTVQSNRSFDEVHKDAQKLGYNKNDYMVHGYQILQSPFTFLYEEFSKRERDKRNYAELMNEGRKKEMVKELVNNYVSLDLLDLLPSEINDFVDFVPVPEDFLKNTNEYDFIRYLEREVVLFHARVLPPPPPDVQH